jgi:putative oxidoreductase
MAQSGNHDRFMPDWIVGGVIRLSLVPGLWYWGRANAGDWPEVVPEAVQAAARWAIPVISAEQIALGAVWGAQLAALLLTIGFLTRFVGLALVMASAVFSWWVAPYAWSSIVVFGALAFYLMVRGGGALSVDGAIAATIR